MNRHGKLADGNARVSVKLTKQEVAALRKMAKSQKRSLSNLLAVLAVEALNKSTP